MTYDHECEVLARHFLTQEEDDVPDGAVKELATQIQEAVEDFINFDLPKLRAGR